MEAQTNVHTERISPLGDFLKEKKYTSTACCHHGYSRPAAAGTKIAAPGADAPTGPQFESSHRKQHLPLGNRGPILKAPTSIWRRAQLSLKKVEPQVKYLFFHSPLGANDVFFKGTSLYFCNTPHLKINLAMPLHFSPIDPRR